MGEGRGSLILKGYGESLKDFKQARDKCMHSVGINTDYRMERNMVGKRKSS